jgi:hypothetical protein
LAHEILAGAGLVTLTKIPPKLGLLADWQKWPQQRKGRPGFRPGAANFFAMCGFLWVYVWTRLNFSNDLINARSQAALLNAIKESPVASLLLRALSLPPAKKR